MGWGQVRGWDGGRGQRWGRYEQHGWSELHTLKCQRVNWKYSSNNKMKVKPQKIFLINFHLMTGAPHKLFSRN